MKYALDEWKNAEVPPVKEITTDGSSALHSALSLCYNKCCFKFYRQWSHIIIKAFEDKIPNCYIRSDIAYLIKTFTRWKSFKKYDPQVKDSYLQIIAYLRTVIEFLKLISTVYDVYIACQSCGVSRSHE